MPSVDSKNERSVKMLGFDCRGAKRNRIDDAFELKSSAKTPFTHTFKQLLTKWPGAFQWETTLNKLPRVDLLLTPPPDCKD